jgi:hypothetical protein
MKKEHDGVIKAIRDKDIQLKMYRRLMTTVNNIKMSTPAIKNQNNELSSLLEGSILEEKYQKKKLSQLRKEIDIALMEYLKIEKTEKSETKKVEELLERNQELEHDLEVAKENMSELNRELEELKTDKELKVKPLDFYYIGTRTHSHKCKSKSLDRRKKFQGNSHFRCLQEDDRGGS